MGHLRGSQITQRVWSDYAATRTVKPHWRRTKAGDPPPEKPRPVALGTLKREFNTLRAALNFAYHRGWLAEPPRLKGPGDSSPRSVYITKDEARRLVDACASPHIKGFIVLALTTGARKEAILQLTWDRVSFRTGRIDFNIPGRRITDKRRGIVPMNDRARAMLTELQALAQTDYVIEWGGKPVTTGIRWPFSRAVQRAGLPPTVTPHVLKHAAASWLAEELVPIEIAAEMLATDLRTLKRVYQKFAPDYLTPAGQALNF